MKKVDVDQLGKVEIVQWESEMVGPLIDGYGGTYRDLANAITDVREDGKTTSASHLSHLRNGNTPNPRLKTLEAWAEVFNMAIIILPQRFKEKKKK